ncbi:ATP-binding protein [Butyrivibrio sp. NC3005]|uniref:ATP-binding protein n=1 Tax=Butyrivibrio sp. NC3005 TaxID=1280685 RepID=UPI00040DA7E4|nr:ATP-binding protein [Butyrivibrio sp. NC3005]
MEKNPFAINFGKVPKLYINRDILIEEITDELLSEDAQNQCFMLTGTRGSGKTVTMTAIEKKISKYDDWIIIRLNPARNMIESLVSKLYDSRDFLAKFIDASVNLSKFGIGVSVSSKPPVADIESALEIILRKIKKEKRKLLVTIDEVSNTSYMKEFASCFQIIIREELPIYLIMAGLYENIYNLENEKDLTFLYRTPKYDMEPLNITLIADKYEKTLGVTHEDALNMAITTKGYPFAYQALGKYLWDSEDKKLSDEVLTKFDEALSHYVYKKIWSELSETDRWYMSFIAAKDSMTVNEILELTKKKKNEFSQYRARLIQKGLIDASTRGVVKCKLPRFDAFIKYEMMF